MSGPYLPPQQPTWRPGYIGSGNGKKGRRGAGTAEDEVVSVPDYAKARADFFADEDVDTNQKPAASGGAGNASSVEGAETDGTGAATDYTKLRENFFGGSLKKNGSEKAEMAELRRRRISKERAEAEEAAKRTREAEEATQEELRRRLAQEEVTSRACVHASFLHSSDPLPTFAPPLPCRRSIKPTCAQSRRRGRMRRVSASGTR